MGKLKELIGVKIKYLRRKKGWTQAVLAEKTNLETTTIARLETGQNFPKEENLEILASVLGVDVQDFFMPLVEEDKDAQILKIKNHLKNLSEKDINIIYKLVKILAVN